MNTSFAGPALAALLLALGAAARAQTGCVASGAAWRNNALPAQAAPFTATFDAVPGRAAMDGVTGLSAGAASGFTSLAAIVRFNNAGYIDARNGGVYAAAAQVPYTAGASYRVRMAVDPAARRYSVYVTPPGAAERLLASGFAFRVEQSAVARLDNWALAATSGSHQVCRFAVTSGGPAADATPPAVTLTPPAAGCVTASKTWKNAPFAAQTSAFTATFEAVPGAAPMDGVTGLSAGGATGFAALAAIVRFNSAGYIDVRDGAAYAAAAAVRYAAGTRYRFRLAVDPAARRYSAWVTGPDGVERALGSAYAFRVEQSGVTGLNNMALYATSGSHQVCAFSVTAGAAPVSDAAPPAVTLTAPASGATVSGAVSVAATASDNVGVVGVQFLLDGASLGAEDVSAPYATTWNAGSASAGAHTLSAVARDAAGNKATSSVSVTAGGPAPSPVAGRDRFGVRMIYPSAAGGKYWVSKWDSGGARTIGAGQIDPQDSWFHGRGNGTYAVDGAGQLKISGSTPRMYIHDPAATGWRDVEITLYGYRVSDDNTPYAGLVSVARTNHSAYGASETVNTCDSRGVGARLRYDGRLDFEKETRHPSATSASAKPMWSTLPYRTWIGYKFIVYDLPNGNVKLESWMDLSDGAGGGAWTKVNELEDNGRNFGVGGPACKPGIDPALRLTSSDARPGSETGRPNVAVYFRSTNVGTNGLIYKRASVREIAP